MRIACPACSAEYDVPDTIVAAGRKVRCARCHEVWAAAPPDEPATADPGAPPAPQPAAQPAAQPVPQPVPQVVPGIVAEAPAPPPAGASPAGAPRPAPPVLRAERGYDTLPGEEDEGDDEDARPASRLWLVAWAASLLILVLGAWAVLHWHAAVIAAWPASVRLFAALGLAGH